MISRAGKTKLHQGGFRDCEIWALEQILNIVVLFFWEKHNDPRKSRGVLKALNRSPRISKHCHSCSFPCMLGASPGLCLLHLWRWHELTKLYKDYQIVLKDCLSELDPREYPSSSLVTWCWPQFWGSGRAPPASFPCPLYSLVLWL